MHAVNVPTQTFESDDSGKFVLVFGIQTVNTSELGNHTHELVSEASYTSSPNETVDVVSKDHTHKVAGSGSTSEPLE